ncbi:MAG: peptidylprolyl isomerase [Nostocaceae cyanobacterium]|nr:peptidylprolyl isomerase [Nostocaceae cyanobacterium]
MSQEIQIAGRRISSTEIIPLLAGYQMLPQLCRRLILDDAIKEIELTAQEKENAIKQFYQKNHLNSPEQYTAFLQLYGMTPEQLEASATSELKIDKFKQLTFGSQVDSYFLSNKLRFDKVIYSLIRTQSMEIAQELFFRINGGEESFADCAKEYSLGPEAQTGGLIGPVELGTPNPMLAKILATAQPGKLMPPTKLGEWVVILRLEKLIPSQLDESMRHKILNSLFENWLQEEIKKTSLSLREEE